jgi:hypothetical protein
MRLTPRSPRGVWLLTAVVWLAAFLFVYDFLPVAPRFVIAASPRLWPREFSADGRMLLAQEYGTFDPSDRTLRPGWPSREDSPNGPFCVWDTVTGRQIATCPKDGRNAVVTDIAPNGFLAVVTEYSGNSTAWSLIDLRTGQPEPLLWPPHGLNRFTADGRFLVYINRTGRTKTVWWDCRGRRQVGVFDGIELQALAADGRWASTHPDLPAGQPATVAIREPVTGRAISRCPQVPLAREPRFSPRGDYLLADDGMFGEVVVVEVATGRVALRLPADPLLGVVGLLPTVPRHRELVYLPRIPEVVVAGQEADEVSLERYDLRSGVCLGRRAIKQVSLIDLPPNLMPVGNCGFLVLQNRDGAPASRLRAWLEHLPIIGARLKDRRTWIGVYEASTGTERSRFCDDEDIRSQRSSPDGGTLLVQKHDGQIEVWDLPPRPRPAWSAGTMAILALPLAGFASWLNRRLWPIESAAGPVSPPG